MFDTFGPVRKILSHGKKKPTKDRWSLGMAQSDLEKAVPYLHGQGFKKANPKPEGKQVKYTYYPEGKTPRGFEPKEKGGVMAVDLYDKSQQIATEEAKNINDTMTGLSQGKRGTTFFISGIENPDVTKTGPSRSKYRRIG